MNTIPQNSTFPEDMDEIGLSLVQQRAVMLMLSGKSIKDIANELEIDRGTFYNWRGKYCNKAYYNRLCEEVKTSVSNGLIGLYSEAVQAISDSLQNKMKR